MRLALIDGEAVVEVNGIASFSALQAALGAREGPGHKAAHEAVFYAFDLLHLNGVDLQPAPLLKRKEALVELTGRLAGAIRCNEATLYGSAAAVSAVHEVQRLVEQASAMTNTFEPRMMPQDTREQQDERDRAFDLLDDFPEGLETAVLPIIHEGRRHLDLEPIDTPKRTLAARVGLSSGASR